MVLKLKGLLVLVTTGELIPVVEACCLAIHWWDLHLCPSLQKGILQTGNEQYARHIPSRYQVVIMYMTNFGETQL